MKKEGHPKYFATQVTCTCGNSFVTGGTRPELRIDICNACHPFYTGEMKVVDAAGRIEKFRSRYGDAGSYGRGAKKK